LARGTGLLFSTRTPAFSWVNRNNRDCGDGGGTMTLTDLRRRIDRLEELARGLAKEVVLLNAANDPLLYVERKTYLTAIQDALAGVEAARVVLAKARQRLEGWAPRKRT
jgi:hypothetical protein